MTFRWEEDLRQSFLQHAQPRLWGPRHSSSHVLSVQESTCSEGRADWVWASLLGPTTKPIVTELFEQPTCSRILAALQVSPQSLESLLTISGVTRQTLRKHLGSLIDLQLVQPQGDSDFESGPMFHLPALEICAFEFKLKNWRRALLQARRYRSFSHRTYVVVPPETAKLAQTDIEAFRRLNVGLISHAPDGRSRLLLLSKKSPPKSQSHFIRAIGLLMRQEDAIPDRLAKSESARIQLAK